MGMISITIKTKAKKISFNIDDTKHMFAIDSGLNYTDLLLFRDFEESDTYLKDLYEHFRSYNDIEAVYVEDQSKNVLMDRIIDKKTFFSRTFVPEELFKKREYFVLTIIEREDFYNGKN